MLNTNLQMMLKVLAMLVAGGVAGCDRLPSMPKQPLASVANDVVADKGRGGYNWRLNGLQFETQRPTSFGFVKQVRPELIRQNLKAPKFEERKTPHKPEGMDEDVYAWFRRYTEAPPETRQILELEQSDDVGAKCVCINVEGNRVLTVANKLIEWDVDTGKRTRQWDAPISKCLTVAYDRSLKTAVLQNAEMLVRVSLDDGRILHTWKPPEGEIEGFVSARDVDVQAVLLKDNQLFALAANFAQVSTYRDMKLTSKRLAIQPKGLWILGVAEGAFMRWRLDQPDKPAEFMSTSTVNESFCMPMSGPLVDRWVDPVFVHEFAGLQEHWVNPGNYHYLSVNLWTLAAASATLDGTQDWLVIVGERYDAQGQATRFIQDIHFESFDYSVPCALPKMDFQRCFFSGNGERLAFVVGEKLRVFERARWWDSNGRMTAQRVAALLAEGRIEQLELCAKELRAQPVFRDGRRGESMYGDVASYIGNYWASLEQQPTTSPEVMDAIQKWYEEGSELALLASAQRHLQIGYTARGTGYADSVDAAAWGTLEERTQQAYADLMRLPDPEKMPARALENLVGMAKFRELDYKDAEKWLAQSAELYPWNPAPLAEMCIWLLPRWGGANGEGGAMVAALAASYPSPESDILYARTALGLATALDAQGMQDEVGFSVLRILDAVDPLLAQGQLTRYEVEALIELARSSQRLDLVRRLADYHVEHFGLPATFAYLRNVVIPIAEAKEAALNKAKERLAK